MLPKTPVSQAKDRMGAFFDRSYHYLVPQALIRRGGQELAVLHPDLIELALDLASLKRFEPEILREDDGSVTVDIKELDIVANAETYATARGQTLELVKEYIAEFLDEIGLYLKAPNRRGHWPYVLRLAMTSSDEALLSALNLPTDAPVPDT